MLSVAASSSPLRLVLGLVCAGPPHARLAPVSRWSMFSLLPLLAVHSPVFGGPVEDPCVRDADGRRSSAGGVVQTCAVWTRSAGESLPATREARNQARPRWLSWERDVTTRRPLRGGAGNLHGLVGPFGQPRPTLIKVHGPCLPPCLWGGLSFRFLYACCGAVSC